MWWKWLRPRLRHPRPGGTVGTPASETAAPAPPQRDAEGAEALLARAGDILLTDGVVKALESVKDSPHVKEPAVVRRLHAWVWNYQNEIPDWVKNQPYLDSVYCQCAVCDHTWLISPLLRETAQTSGAGAQCRACGRVLCPQCAKVAGAECGCGQQLFPITSPNGRSRQKMESELKPPTSFDDLRQGDTPDAPTEATKELHLYFGFEGRLPIGVDPSFPLRQTEDAATHLCWAEMLADAGIYYQAQQQLDMLGEPAASSAPALWLRARLEMVTLRNRAERLRRRLDFSLHRVKPEEKIKGWLEQAVALSPDFGPAWLTLAQARLDKLFGQNLRRALECARRAHELLGPAPEVLFALGRALRETGQAREAVEFLRAHPSAAEKGTPEQRELELAELEALCQAEPPDPAAYLRLGRWYFSHEERDKAREIFTRIAERRPDRAEGFYGLGRLALVDRQTSARERLEEAHRLAREALARDPQFGLAYELLGNVFGVASYRREISLTFAHEDPIPYYRRACQYDDTCDTAMLELAEDHLKRGELEPALKLLERADELGTTHDAVYFTLAVIYRGLRKFEKEERARRRAKELAPDIELTAEREQELLRLCGFEY